MPTQYDMREDDDLYRAILEYEYQPVRHEPNPNYGKQGMGYQPYRLSIPDGPVETKTMCIGPYSSTRPIKSYITRNRGRHTNLRIKQIQKVGSWVEVPDA